MSEADIEQEIQDKGLNTPRLTPQLSACASPENFDAELGRKIARDNARNKIRALEGYLLKQRLSEAK